ncbi:MAG TPA: sodium:proton antiporter [Pyrinomonadaceae bacterium]|nr:sodium:proton antiporter [Pyrinomonadaceae bacterium]
MNIETIEVLLLIAAVVAMLARRLRIPYSIGLVVAGTGLALAPFSIGIELTKELLFTALLPPLIFEAAFQIRWPELRKDLPVVLALATIGVVISAAATAVGMHYAASWPWMSAIVFGLLIAATDPVSVIATFKEAKIQGRIRLLVEAESLFNDGTAAAAFTLALVFAAGESTGTLGILKTFGFLIFGSIICGAVVAGLVLLLSGATQDHLVEVTFTTVAAFGSFLLAEHFHGSGVLATLTTGLIIGNVGHLAISSTGRRAVVDFWEYAAFVANSLIFLLIGLRLANQNYRTALVSAIAAIIFVIVARALAVYPLSLLFARSRRRITLWHQNILFWGGLRGALALALALGIPETMPNRQEIITVAFAVVAFSIIVQGLTIIPLLRREVSTETS